MERARAEGEPEVPVVDLPDPYEFWRIYITANDGDASFTQIQELEVYADEARLDLVKDATLTASSFFGSLGAANVKDQSYAESAPWVSASGQATPSWIRMQFPAPVSITEIQLRQPTGSRTRAPKDFEVQYSADGVNFTTLWAVTGQTAWGDREARYFRSPDYTPPAHTGSRYGAHAYWSVLALTNAGTAHSLAELEFRATPGGADQANGGTPISLSDFGGSFVKGAAFDNNNATAWAGGDDWSWIGYQFAAPVEVAEVAITARSDDPTQTLSRGAVRYSDDGINWSSVWEIVSPAAWTGSQTRVFTDPDFV
jgi:hypothetical protein